MIIFIKTRNPARSDCHRIVKNIRMRCFYACTYLVKNANDKRLGQLEPYYRKKSVWKEIGNEDKDSGTMAWKTERGHQRREKHSNANFSFQQRVKSV